MVVWGEGNHGGNNSHEVVEYGVFAKNIADFSAVEPGEGLDDALFLGSDGSFLSRTFSFQAIVDKLKTVFSGKEHKHSWNAITGKPDAFEPSSHIHDWASITGKPSTFAPSSHSHSWDAITGKPGSFTPSSHNHSWDAITGKPSTFAPSAHTHTPEQVGALPITGGTLTGSLRLKNNTNFGLIIYFGDDEYVKISEPEDDVMEITAKELRFSSHNNNQVASKKPLPVLWGGTGKSTPLTADDVGAAKAVHNHTLSQITGFPSIKAGTGSGSVTFGDVNSSLDSTRPSASGKYSVAEGWGTSASGRAAHASGFDTQAIGDESYAGGDGTQALGDCSFAIGAYTIADNAASFACGFHNKPQHTEGQAINEWGETDSLLYVGNGHGGTPEVKSNAFRVTRDGKVYGLSSFKASGADYAEFFEWADANLQGEDRVGRFVTMEGDKIKLAQPGDYILGIVSGNPCIVGNSDEDWRGRWLRDDFDRFIREYLEYDREEVTVPEGMDEGEFLADPTIIKKGDKFYRVTSRIVDHETPFWRLKANPDYDPSQAYVERQDRPEWDAVGMLGVLAVWDDGTCQVNGFAQVAQDGTATAAEGYVPGMTYRVIERVADNIVKIIFR